MRRLSSMEPEITELEKADAVSGLSGERWQPTLLGTCGALDNMGLGSFRFHVRQ